MTLTYPLEFIQDALRIIFAAPTMNFVHYCYIHGIVGFCNYRQLYIRNFSSVKNSHILHFQGFFRFFFFFFKCSGDVQWHKELRVCFPCRKDLDSNPFKTVQL